MGKIQKTGALGLFAVVLLALLLRVGSDATDSSSLLPGPEDRESAGTLGSYRAGVDHNPSMRPRKPVAAGVGSESVPNAFRGELWINRQGTRQLLTDPARILITPSTELARDVGKGRWLPNNAIRTFPDFGDADMPTACEGTWADVLDGGWEMPIPEADVIVWQVQTGGRHARTLEGESIAAGDSAAAVEIELLGMGLLFVRDSVTGEPLHNVRVFSTIVIPHGVHARTNRSTGESWKSKRVQEQAGPPKWADSLTRRSASPVSIPLSDQDRELWIGKEGYAWARLDWSSEAEADEIELAPVGSLAVSLSNVRSNKGILSLDVTPLGWRQKAVGGWSRISTDGTFVARSIPAGVYRVRVRSRENGARAPLYLEDHEVVAARDLSVAIDVAELRLEEQPAGSLIVRVLDPWNAGPGDHRILVGASSGRSVGAPFFNYSLETLRVTETGYEAKLPELGPGSYLVGLSPCGWQETIVVQPGQESVVEFDLAEVAEVCIYPDSGDASIRPADLRLMWRHIERDRASADINGGRVWELLNQEVSWTGEAWCFSSTVGEIAYMATTKEGAAASAINVHALVAGPNDLALVPSEFGAGEVVLSVFGLSEGELLTLYDSLPSLFVALDGEGECLFARRVEGATMGVNAESFRLHFTRPGAYSILLPDLPGHSLVGQNQPFITIQEGASVSLELTWE